MSKITWTRRNVALSLMLSVWIGLSIAAIVTGQWTSPGQPPVIFGFTMFLDCAAIFMMVCWMFMECWLAFVDCIDR